MLTVVMVHLHNYAIEVPENIKLFMSVLGNFRMPLFFFVSGYIINKVTKIGSISDLFSFYKKKAIALLLPVIMWSIVVKNYFFTRSFSLPTIQDIFNCFNGENLWFLSTLFYYMLTVGLFKLFSGSKGKGLWIFPFAWVFFIIIYYFTGILKMGCLYFPYFVLGIVVSMFERVDLLIKTDKAYYISFLIFAFTSGYWVSGASSIFNLSIRLATALSAICFFYNLIVRITWISYLDRLIRLIGVNTLGIYVMHWYFLGNITLANNWFFALIELIIFSVFIALACIVIQKIFEQSYILNLLFYGKTKKRKK